MNLVINKIKEKISKYSDIKIVDQKDNSITIRPTNIESFPITLIANFNKFSVYFKGWHQDFDKEEDALDCLAYGLSDDCRLQVISYGKVEYKWIVEYKEKGKWVQDSEVDIGLNSFWQKKKVAYYQNNIIKYEGSKK
ncbi:MAG: hypothetical protein H7263_15830 [Candidatus Sericytochromatia bacterium]|nr:hypothetical protein [Candidatus Sericytochromatia bacterium]